VLVDSATMINSTEAVGINFYPGGSVHGLPVTTNVTFQSIVDRNSDYTVAAESYYGKGAAYCKSLLALVVCLVWSSRTSLE
jgi:hypothetical protein